MTADSHQLHRRFPEKLAFTLDSRIRRFLEPPGELISKLDLRRTDVVMDFGCGPGFYTIPLARTAARIIAVDVSARMLERTASNARKEGMMVECLRSDGTHLQIADQSVDLVFLNHVFHEITDRPKALGEFLRILKPRGRLVVVERTRGGLLAGRFGPRIIDEIEVNREIQNAEFTSIQTIQHANNSILIGQKP